VGRSRQDRHNPQRSLGARTFHLAKLSAVYCAALGRCRNLLLLFKHDIDKLYQHGGAGAMLDERDHKFATDVLNASLTLMSILVVVITFFAVEYKSARTYLPSGEPIHNAIVGTTLVSGYAGCIALVALIQVRSGRWRTSPLAWAFGGLIVILTLGVLYVGFFLMA